MIATEAVNAILVCVGYDDFLRLTLPRTLQHVSKLVVVTTPTDLRTLALCAMYPRVIVHKTLAFYDDGASFNKGKALEEGFDVLGRTGWVLIMDADILLPEKITTATLDRRTLYTPVRRIMSKVDGLTATPTINPSTLPLRKEYGNFGYFQLFHATDPVVTKLPWYETDWVHAGGADSVFEKRWHKKNKARMSFEVIHLGDPDQNWYGRTRPRLDNGEVSEDAANLLAKQQALHRKYGWKGYKKTGEAVVERLTGDPTAAEPCHKQDKPRRRVVFFHQSQGKHRPGKTNPPPTQPRGRTRGLPE